MLKKIRAEQVAIGMYVRRFHGNWLRHPFWRARFIVKTEQQLERIHDAALDVSIDVEKGIDLPADTARPFGKAAAMPASLPARPIAPRPSAAPVIPFPAAQARPMRKVTAPVAFGRADKLRAVALAQRSTSVVKALFEDCQLGRTVPVGQILSVVDDITCTLEQNSSAFLSVTRLKSKDDGTYIHSIAVCALMIGLAREAGLPAREIQALGTAGLLHDVGKILIAEGILHKDEALTPAEIAEVRRHPQHSHTILSTEKGLAAVVLDVALNHHERLDGTGYPSALPFKDISPAACMAAICDSYEAMTSGTKGGKGMSPIEAITALHGDMAYDEGLLFKFMRSIGVFPAKMLVRLRSNRLGLILPSPGEDRRPVARAFYSTMESGVIGYEDTVLSDSLGDDQAIGEEDADLWFSAAWPEMCARITAGKPMTQAILTAGSSEATRAAG